MNDGQKEGQRYVLFFPD